MFFIGKLLNKKIKSVAEEVFKDLLKESILKGELKALHQECINVRQSFTNVGVNFSDIKKLMDKFKEDIVNLNKTVETNSGFLSESIKFKERTLADLDKLVKHFNELVDDLKSINELKADKEVLSNILTIITERFEAIERTIGTSNTQKEDNADTEEVEVEDKEEEVKPKRKRRTKAEIEAEKSKECEHGEINVEVDKKKTRRNKKEETN